MSSRREYFRIPDESAARKGLSLAAAAIPLAALLTFSAGCGSADYSAQMEKRMVELQQVSAFAALFKDPTDDLPVNLRVPIAMTKAYDFYSVDPLDPNVHVVPTRVLPPFMNDGIGFRRTFEGNYEPNPTNSTPYYLTIWEFDAPRPKDGLNNLRDLVRFQLHDDKANWEPVEVKTPEGTTLTWQRLHVKGDQLFESKHNNAVGEETVAGVFELWAFETPGWDVLLGWRASDDAWDKATSGDTKLSDLPTVVAGTIRFTPDQSRNKKPVPAIGRGLWTPRPIGKSAAPDAPAPSNGAAAPTDTSTPTNTQPNAATNATPPANDAAPEQASETEAVLKRFLTALLTHDEGELRATSIADPDLAILLEGTPTPASGIEGEKNAIAAGKFRHLKVGDEVKLPGGANLVLDNTHVNANQEQIVWNNGPIPFILEKKRDGWKVNAAPLVVARKAAAAARQAEANAASPSPPADSSAAPIDERFTTLAEESERTQFSGHRTNVNGSIRFPKGWVVHDGPFAKLEPKPGETLDPAFSERGASINVSVLPNPSFTPKSFLDGMEQGGPTGKASLGSLPGKFKLIEREELTIDGHPAAYFAAVSLDGDNDLVYASYEIPAGSVAGNVHIRIKKSAYEKIKDVVRQCALTFRFEGNLPDTPAAAADDAGRRSRARRPPPPDSVAGVPNPAKPADPAAAAAPPAKAGPAELEFTEGVTGSITFPAGFEHEGKAPQASTPAPMQVDPTAGAQQPNTIKIEVKKLGQGVNYIELHKEALTSEIQTAVDAKTLERGNCSIAGVSGDYIVVAVGESGTPARGAAEKADKEATRKRIVYIANVAPKHLAVKITAEMKDADYKTLKEEMKKCVRSLKFD
jgi:hypothetical protein